MATALPVYPLFDISSSSLGPKWEKYVGRLENLFIAMGTTHADKKKALLLHYAGEDVYNIFETLTLEAGDADVYIKAKNALVTYFKPKVNHEYEKYVFRQSRQEKHENLDTFCTRLRQLSQNCDFTDNNAEIKSQIIQGCISSNLRKKALKDDNITLDDLLKAARALEIADTQSKGMEANVLQVNRVMHRKPSKQEGKKYTCYNCGGEYPHETECPAKGKTCTYCKRVDHFENYCKTKSRNQKYSPRGRGSFHSRGNSFRYRGHSRGGVNQISEPLHTASAHSSDEDEYVFSVQQSQCKTPQVNVSINGVSCSFLADSGASVNIMDQESYLKLTPLKLSTANTGVFAYGSQKSLPVIGKFTAKVIFKTQHANAEFLVVTGNTGSLLGFSTASQLGIINIVNNINQNKAKPAILEEFKDITQGLGMMKGYKVKLHIDENVRPVMQPHRRIPFHLRSKVEEELKYLEQEDIIEKVEGPTPWVSPIVAAPKPKNPDKVRICVDMRRANQAIQRERHPLPTMDDLIYELNGSTVFSKLDLNHGYHQLEIAPECRNITTFVTHVGLRRYKRLNYGVNAASEIFQQAIESVIKGIPGSKNISDDIIIHGVNREEHDKSLRGVLQRLREYNLTLNSSKCEFYKTSIEFFGQIWSQYGLSPDPRKVEAIKNAEAPKSATEVRSLLGMANYCARFIRNFANITHSLRQLTHKSVPFQWGEEHTAALNTLKDSITQDQVMAYYDPNKETNLIVDASPVGLGAILTQNDRPIAYASRSLSKAESNYSQIDREALAIVWGIEHFHLYLYGAQFNVTTDHKPLVTIFNNGNTKSTARCERWCLRLQTYQFEVKYSPGKENPADYMSRHPLETEDGKPTRSEIITENYINMVESLSTPNAISTEELQEETNNDATLNMVKRALKDSQNWHKHEELLPYLKIRDELSTTENGIILRGTRIIVPQSLQRSILALAHEGHQGIIKTKSLLREKVWFPKIDEMTQDLISKCTTCQITTSDTRFHPVQMSDLPSAPWVDVSADFSGPYPTGEYLLVVIDDYSRFPVVEIVRSTSGNTVIPVLDKIFAVHGIPETLKTDNGPPFNGDEIRKFAKKLGLKHRKITPLWPRSNATAESFMKPLNKAVLSATAEGRNWKQDLYKFLRNYRATPHCTTDVSPAKALFKRSIRIKLPEITAIADDEAMRTRDKIQKQKMKVNFDKRHVRNPHYFSEGDTVIVKQRKEHKLQTPFDPNPYHVTNRNGTMITAERGDHKITRNASHFKPAPDAVVEPATEDEITMDPSNSTPPSNPSNNVTQQPERRFSTREKRFPQEKYKDFVL